MKCVIHFDACILHSTHNFQIELYISVCRVGKRRSSLCKMRRQSFSSCTSTYYYDRATNSDSGQLFFEIVSISDCTKKNPDAIYALAIRHLGHGARLSYSGNSTFYPAIFVLSKCLSKKSVE